MTTTLAPVSGSRQPESTAWLILWLSFFGFCALMVLLLVGANWYRENATRSLEARVDTVISGPIGWQSSSKPEWAVLDRETFILREGDSVKTYPTGQTMLVLFDGSTMLLFPDTELHFTRLQTSLFGPKANFATVTIRRGKAIVAVARPPEGRTEFTVQTPHGRAVLQEGSYAFTVADQLSSVKVRERGRAFVTVGGRTVDVRERERADMATGVSDPRPAAQELIVNNNFADGLQQWQRVIDERNCGPLGPAPARINRVVLDGRASAHFLRSNARNVPCEIALRQDINVDVTEFWTLRLSIEGAVMAQSVSGGGWVGTEYPLMVRVKYRAADGAEDMIVRGFYAQNEAGNPTDNGAPVIFNQWFQFSLDHDLMARQVRPRQILSVEVVAGGHDYESYIRQVSLIGE